MDDKPFALAMIDNLHRTILVFEKNLAESNEHASSTHRFLETLASALNNACLYQVLLAIRDSARLDSICRNYLPFLTEKYFLDHGQYDHLAHCFLPIITYSSIWNIDQRILTSFESSRLCADVHANPLALPSTRESHREHPHTTPSLVDIPAAATADHSLPMAPGVHPMTDHGQLSAILPSRFPHLSRPPEDRSTHDRR